MEEIKILHRDEVAEWLRRWTANPMGSARVGSNPILVGKNFMQTFYFSMLKGQSLDSVTSHASVAQ